MQQHNKKGIHVHVIIISIPLLYLMTLLLLIVALLVDKDNEWMHDELMMLKKYMDYITYFHDL